MRSLRWIIAVGGLAAVLTVTGCATTTAPAVTSPSAAAPTPETRPLVLPSAGTESGGDAATFPDQQEAVAVAEAALTAVVNHDRPYDEWWPDLSQYLAVDAQHAWEYTDPRLVSASTVTGLGSVVAAPSSTLIVVGIPTDAGVWRLEMVRQVEDGAGQGPWLAFTLTPPDEKS